MPIDNLSDRLASLTERERQIAQAVCTGRDYKELAEELGIKKGTVKSTMGHVYLKMGLEEESRTRKRKALFEEICVGLADGVLPAPPPEPPKRARVPRQVRRMVRKDERALVYVGQKREGRAPSIIARGRGYLLRLANMVLLFLIIALAVFAALVGVVYLLTGELPAAGQFLAGDGLDLAELRPAATSIPTVQSNTGLSIGEWYTQGAISMAVRDISLRQVPSVYIGLDVSVRNVSQQTISFEYGDHNFLVRDNLGNTYAT